MDKLLAKLSEQQAVINKQHEALRTSEDLKVAYTRTAEYISASSSVPITPVTETFNNSAAPTTNPPSVSGEETATPSAEEVLRLKAELEAAKGKIARMDQELVQSRITKHTLDQAIGNASEADFLLNLQSEGRLNHLPHFQRDGSWATQEDARSDTSDALSAGDFNRAREIWGNSVKPVINGLPVAVPAFQPSEALSTAQWMNRGFGQPFVEAPMKFAAPPMNAFRGDLMMQDPELLMAPSAVRRPAGGRFNRNNRNTGSFPYASSNSAYDGFNPASSTAYGSAGGMAGGITPIGGQMAMGMGSGMNMGSGMYSGYQPQPIGTPLSPHAPEFTSAGSGWKNDVSIQIPVTINSH